MKEKREREKGRKEGKERKKENSVYFVISLTSPVGTVDTGEMIHLNNENRLSIKKNDETSLNHFRRFICQS